MPTLVMDLDGTICEQTSGGEDYFSAKPIRVVIDKMKEFRLNGWSIIIYTARFMNRYGGDSTKIPFDYYARTEWWLKDNDVPFDKLVFGKPAGDIYVDDKGMRPDEFASRNF